MGLIMSWFLVEIKIQYYKSLNIKSLTPCFIIKSWG